MKIPVVDTINWAKANTMLAGEHFASAVKLGAELKGAAPESAARRLAAARVIDEVDHGLLAAKELPGVGLVPGAAPALNVYSIARKVLRLGARTPIGAEHHPVLAAANLLGARSHVASAMRIHVEQHVSRAERFQAVKLLETAIDDAKMGYRLADHPAGERPALEILEGVRNLVHRKQPVDQAQVTSVSEMLEQAARAVYPH